MASFPRVLPVSGMPFHKSGDLTADATEVTFPGPTTVIFLNAVDGVIAMSFDGAEFFDVDPGANPIILPVRTSRLFLKAVAADTSYQLFAAHEGANAPF